MVLHLYHYKKTLSSHKLLCKCWQDKKQEAVHIAETAS